jgi:hypothetical protein
MIPMNIILLVRNSNLEIDVAAKCHAGTHSHRGASRMVLFRVYYLGLASYGKARHFVGWSERSWVNWAGEIRRHCGTELLRRGMFPQRYFAMAALLCAGVSLYAPLND